MSSSPHPYMTVRFEDGSIAIVGTNPRKPRLLEVIAVFFDAARARDYADRENSRSAEPPVTEPAEAPAKRGAEPTAAMPDLSPRQSAVIKALRSKMDENGRVAEKAVDLAKAAQIPLGSLHSVLQSLEKKQLIKTARTGSARAPAVYQVL